MYSMPAIDNWCIDPKNTCVLVPTGADGPITPQLAGYLHSRFPTENVCYVIKPRKTVLEMRNLAMEEIVLDRGRKFEHFVWFDDDLKPGPMTDEMFRVQGDIVGAMFTTRSQRAWLRPDSVHCSAMRFHRRVVEAMAKPFYRDTYNDAYTQRTDCECNWFTSQAKKLGFTVARAGWADHGNQGKWCG